MDKPKYIRDEDLESDIMKYNQIHESRCPSCEERFFPLTVTHICPDDNGRHRQDFTICPKCFKPKRYYENKELFPRECTCKDAYRSVAPETLNDENNA